jgi:ABC-type molybdenum transport system ATPase subunit/photorepair protein PhrA
VQYIETEVKYEDGRTGKIAATLRIQDVKTFASQSGGAAGRLHPRGMTRQERIGEVVLDLQNISLRFGGVKALTDISFDVREHEIRAIIGPNGAGKSSMLNVINGVYHPQEGKIIFRGEERRKMEPHEAARRASRAPSRTSRCSRA